MGERTGGEREVPGVVGRGERAGKLSGGKSSVRGKDTEEKEGARDCYGDAC